MDKTIQKFMKKFQDIIQDKTIVASKDKIQFVTSENNHEKIRNWLKENLYNDGYHTMSDLYEHRNRLFISLINELHNRNHIMEGNEIYTFVWKSKLHSDGTSFDGYFIAGFDSGDNKFVTYHIPMYMWNNVYVPVMEKAPPWDGHTSSDVIDRLIKFNQS